MTKRIATPHPIRCSFCGRGQDEVARLVSGPSVYICSECVKLCNDILEGEIEREQPSASGALPNARMMIHQPLGGTQGQTTDIEIYTREMLKMKDQLNGILAKHCGKTIEQIDKDTDRNNFMSAAEAKAYGLIDEILDKRR